MIVMCSTSFSWDFFLLHSVQSEKLQVTVFQRAVKSVPNNRPGKNHGETSARHSSLHRGIFHMKINRAATVAAAAINRAGVECVQSGATIVVIHSGIRDWHYFSVSLRLLGRRQFRVANFCRNQVDEVFNDLNCKLYYRFWVKIFYNFDWLNAEKSEKSNRKDWHR